MYAFGPLPKYKQSGRIIGTHQKIDRVVRRRFKEFETAELPFPSIKDILHFEGSRGPDGIKLKSPGHDEPWHFIDPQDFTDDDPLFVMISDHIHNLAVALMGQDSIRAAYEAAWLAHAVTDGLTPAHHEALKEHLAEIKKPHDGTAEKFRAKVVMSGHGSARMFVRNNWRYWGAKGLMTTHTLFEAGVATTAKPRAFVDATIADEEWVRLADQGFLLIYQDMIRQIAQLNMYERFKHEGWTRTLASETTKILLPTIIRAVTLAWLEAYNHAREEQL